MNIVETKQLTKLFAKFVANDRIDIAVKEGEIRAVIGENGAGKTTLMNMLYGMIKPTSGEIYIKGRQVKLTSPKVAIENGLGMVHQHFKLVPGLTVYENIMLGAEITKLSLVDVKTEKERINALIDKYNFNLNADDRVEDISIGAKQRVEILKMLYRDVDILIFDEPTSVLTPQEVDELIENLFELRAQGKTIIIITHKLQEVKKLADTITVIRRGRVIGTIESKDATMEQLAQMMVGRSVIMQVDRSAGAGAGEVIYEVDGLSVKNSMGLEAVKNLSLKVHKNEILGIAGVEGNGQTELAKTLSGMMTSSGGSVRLNGEDITDMWPDRLRAQKVGIIPEDRYEEGLCRDMKVSQNLIAGYHNRQPVCKKGFLLDKKEIKKNKSELVERYDIRLSADDPNVSGLSGGNAQKIIIAREFSADPDMLLCCQPTRGVDVGSIETIHKQIIDFRNQGKAVLLISSELSEIMALSDRIAVMFKGEIVGEFNAGETTPEELGLYMTGAKRNSG